MYTFTGSNYSQIYRNALIACKENGESSPSRVGDMLDLGFTSFEFTGSEAGLPFILGRGLNPFFALAEIIWFYVGSNELNPLSRFISNYDQYSDDGSTLNGAYGYRIQHAFGFNQLESVINELEENPYSRRAVISLYGPSDLQNTKSLDIPCNISVLFKIRNNSLDITVYNRSNDLFKGLPYNLFLFRFLQYVVSRRLNISIGIHRHVSDSVHLYESDISNVELILSQNVNKNISFNMNIFDEIINCSNQIQLSDLGNVDSEWLKKIFSNYECFKKTKKKSCFKSLHDDIMYEFICDWLNTHHSSA